MTRTTASNATSKSPVLPGDGASEETRVCKTCGLEKPLDEFAKQLNGYRHLCRACKNMQQNAQRVLRDDTPRDEDAWDGVAVSPTQKPPLRKPWVLVCQMCGDRQEGRWTMQEARAVSLYIMTHKKFCHRCGSDWLNLEPGEESFRENVAEAEAAA